MSGQSLEPSADVRVLRWERAARGRWGAYLTEAEERALELALRLAPATTALDVGCGSGRWSQMARGRGWRVTCADVDAEALELCRRRMPDVTCVQMDEQDETVPAKSGSVGLLIVIEVPPVVERSSFPAEAARVLSSGGFIVCTYHNSHSLRGVAYRALRRRLPFYGGPPFSVFKQRLIDSGFEILHTEGLGWFPFRRESNSPLIPIAAKLEKLLGFRKLTRLSPFVVVVARLASGRPLH